MAKNSNSWIFLRVSFGIDCFGKICSSLRALIGLEVRDLSTKCSRQSFAICRMCSHSSKSIILLGNEIEFCFTNSSSPSTLAIAILAYIKDDKAEYTLLAFCPCTLTYIFTFDSLLL